MKKLKEFIDKVGMDKVAHFFGVAFVTLIVSLVFNKANPGFHPVTYAACGFIGGALVAIGKEAADFFSGDDFENFNYMDVAYSILGAFVSFLLALSLR